MTPPPAVPPPGGPRRPLPGWLWAVGGVVVASAVWGGVLVLTVGGSENSPSEPPPVRPNLAGYTYAADMCETADTSAFDVDYQADGYREPSELAYEHRALDRSACTFYLSPLATTGYSSLYLTYDAVWHKGTSPRAEFAASYRQQEQYEDVNYDYAVEPVDGLGDEAFIVYQTDTLDDGRLARVVLAVREGWFVHTLTWDAYIDPAEPEMSELADPDHVGEAMREATEETLATLRGEVPLGGTEPSGSPQDGGGSPGADA
ncbi:hypothetical protein ACTWP5_08920 [Streptomyces sp. 4N509B]|uniref:hypothetical protein n=1 Tax=Streptomyces sp. 4N509B TaxID=3457413 RepID=UPI003FD61EBD